MTTGMEDQMGIPVLLGSILLATHPLVWLAGTWIDPAYDSAGLLVAVTAAGLLGWSLSSARGDRSVVTRPILAGLAATATVRLLAQVLAINALGALTLALDIWLIARWLGLERRARPLAPAWLAVTFALSLPIERIVQRILGFGLQSLSSDGACALLALAGPTDCDGVTVHYRGTAVMVDLPCSGAGGLTLQLVLFAALATLSRPAPGAALLGLTAALTGALAANMLRVAALTAGLVHTPVDILADPWHSAVGLVALALGAVPSLIWARTVRPWLPPLQHHAPQPARLPAPMALGFMAAAMVIVLLPARPADVSRPLAPPTLPAVLAGAQAEQKPLTAGEHAYFTRYGGAAVRAGYGGHGLLVVTTTAPLRHLHAPDECLEGAGHRVRYLGPTANGIALYRSTDPAGAQWRVLVGFMSDRGHTTATVAEAVWLWLRHPDTTWTMIQRVSPWDAPAEAVAAWEAAVATALDIPAHPGD